MIRYARAPLITDAHPELREAADFDAFEAEALAYRGRRKGEHYVCGPMRPNGAGKPHRAADCALPRAWLPFDFDAIADRDVYADLRLWFARFRGFGYETASSTEDAPRCRIVLALDREADRDECMRIGAAVARDVAEEFGQRAKLDASVFRPEQAIYTPLRDAQTFTLEGEPLPVDTYLAAAPEGAQSRAERPGDAGGRIPEGGRNAFLLSLAGTMRRRGMSPEAIEAALLAENAARCDPPLPADEVRQIARSVSRYAAGEARAPARDAGDWTTDVPPVEGSTDAPRGGSDAAWPPPLDLAALALREPDPPRFVVADWLPAGYATLLAGHGGVGKSAMALHLACCIALGRDFAGLGVMQRRVLYLSCEDRENVLHWRLDRICRHLRISLADLAGRLDIVELVGRDAMLWDRDPRTGACITTAFGQLEARMRDIGAEVLMVDGVTDTFAGNENARADVKRYVNALLALVPSDTGALLLLGHVAKPTASAGATGEGYSGSTGWHNAVRARWYLYPETARDDETERAQRTGRLLLELQKSNLGPTDQAMGWRWDDSAHMFLPEAPASHFDRVTQQRDEQRGILLAFKACADAGIPVPAAATGRRTAFHVLSAQSVFPDSMRAGKPSVRRFWREIERMRAIRLVCDDSIRRDDRHRVLTLALTSEGVRACGQ